MQQRLRDEELLALEDQRTEGELEGRQAAEPGLEIIGQEMVSVENAGEDDTQFRTPARQPTEGSMVARIGEIPNGPRGEPKSLAPQPLFSERQLSMLDDMYKRHSSPLLPRNPPMSLSQSLPTFRPSAYGSEEVRQRMAQEMLLPPPPAEIPRPQVFRMASGATSTEQELEAAEERSWRKQVGRELRKMGQMLQQANDENLALKEEIAMIRLENRFYTPESEKNRPKATATAASTTAPRTDGQERQPAPPTSQMDLLIAMMQNMQEIQKRMLSRDDNVEVVICMQDLNMTGL